MSGSQGGSAASQRGDLVPSLEGFEVRNVPAVQARKAYRCPSCHNGIMAGEGHVVVWPLGDVTGRRHWHRHCWRIAVRRGRVGG